MIICKRPAPPDDHLQKAGGDDNDNHNDNDNDNDNNNNNNNNNRGDGEVIRMTEVTRAPWSRGDGTEGGEEGKGEGGDWPQKIFFWYCGIRNSALAVEGMEECFYSRTTAQ